MKGQTKKEMKQDVNSKRDEQKQDVMRRGWKKTCKKEKNRKRFIFKNTEEFFQRERDTKR